MSDPATTDRCTCSGFCLQYEGGCQCGYQERREKPTMTLDAAMPRKMRVPVHPDTGEVLTRTFEELAYLAAAIRFASTDEEHLRDGWRRDYDALVKESTFREEPYIAKSSLMMGAGAANRFYTKYGQTRGSVETLDFFTCHPETWAAMPDDEKARFNLLPDE